PWISSSIFGVYGLLSYRHAVRLERCAFVCGRHAARTCAKAACSNSHSQGQAAVSVWSWVPLFLPYDLLLFLLCSRADVSLSSGFPRGVCFFGNPCLMDIRPGRLLIVSTSDESAHEGYPVPMVCFAFP